MNAAAARGAPGRRARRLVGAVLAAWALGLAVATAQLHVWQQALAPVLVQLHADALVRESAGREGETVQPEWYRRRALTLLGAVEHLHDDQWWTLVMPGSWAVFDDLEERATQRVGQAFGLVVVETIRHELEARSMRITGLPAPQAECHAPWSSPQPPAGLDLADMPEYAAMQRLLDEAAGIDQAVQALLALRQDHQASAAQLRILVHHSLGATLSAPASRSLALFRVASDPQDPRFEALTLQLQWALRCSALKGMAALHERLVERNPVLALEDELAALTLAVRFDPASPGEADDASAHARRVTQWQRVADLLADGQTQLAAGSTAWMAPDGQDFGPAHARLLERMAAIGLLGPPFAQRLRQQAHLEHTRLQQQVRRRLAGAQTAIAWQAPPGGFVASARSEAVRTAIAALLHEPFLAMDPVAATSPQGLAALVDQRLHFTRAVLPLFEPSQRPAVTRYVDLRIGALAFAGAREFLTQPPEPIEFTLQRLAQLEAALQEAGAPALATWLGQRLAVEVLSCTSLATTACAAQSPANLQQAPAPDPRAPWDSEGALSAPASGVD